MNAVQTIRDTTAVLITGIVLLTAAWDLARPAADPGLLPDRAGPGDLAVWLGEAR